MAIDDDDSITIFGSIDRFANIFYCVFLIILCYGAYGGTGWGNSQRWGARGA